MKTTLKQRFSYRFDNIMSKGPIAMISLLGLLSLIIVLIAGAIIWGFKLAPEGQQPLGFIEGVWQSFMRSIDTGTVAGDNGWHFRILAFFVTLGGIFILSTLIGVLSSGIESKLDNLRKGRSFVIEKDHTLILGWSSKVFTIISELVIANENQKKPRIVILANKDKVDMEDEIHEKLPDLKNTKVICRSGSPNDMVDLSISNPQASKSIIILAPEAGNADAQTIKTILAITNNPDRRKAPYHIVAEIKEDKNVEVAEMVGKNEVELILTDDVIARIMVQTSRQSGLSIVYTELMDFDGAEIYFNDEKLLYGKPFADSLFAYEDSAVMGLKFADGSTKVNPPMGYIIEKGDQIIAITEDDDTLIVNKKADFKINEDAIAETKIYENITERILILGWNKRARIIIKEMDTYIAKGSYMRIVSTYDYCREEIAEAAKNLKNINLEFEHADTTAKEVLEALDVTSYASVQVLCYVDFLELQEADAQTLITLLHLRRICEEKGKEIKIVSEMLDLRNRDLAAVTKADDFIVSDKLISLLMSQISENKYLMGVFKDLFDADGSEIYLKPITDYIRTNVAVNFYTLLESAKRKGQIAIGYRIAADHYNSNKAYGVVVNPKKSAMINFNDRDKIIVIAED